MSHRNTPGCHRKSYRWHQGDVRSPKYFDAPMEPAIFCRIEKLYHYTSLDSAKKIISSGTLRMSPQSKVNDINESNRFISWESNITSDVFNEAGKYHQTSLTSDEDKKPGFAISPMWGHYAQRGKGVCLVFDKKRLLTIVERKGYDHGKVEYSDIYDSSILVRGEPEEYFKKNIKHIFFSKSADWSYEREYRVIGRTNGGQMEIPIKDSLMAVIVYTFEDINENESPLSSATYSKLFRSLKTLNIPLLLFSLHSLNDRYELWQYRSESDSEGCIWYPEDPLGLS